MTQEPEPVTAAPIPAPPTPLEATPAPAPDVPATPASTQENPVIPVIPVIPVATPISTPPTPAQQLPEAPKDEMVPLQYLNADVKEVLGHYEKLTKRQLVYNGSQMVGAVSIFTPSAGVPKDEAIKIIEMTLATNQVHIIPTEDPKIWRVTNAGLNPKSLGVPFIINEALLPENEAIVMYLMKLEHADPTELAQTINQGILVPNPAGYTTIVPLPKSNSLLITENTAMIRTLIRIIRAIDVEPVSVISEFITLEHGEAEDIVQKLEKLFEKPQEKAGGGGPGQPQAARAVAGPNGEPVPAGAPVPADGSVSVELTGGDGVGPTEDNIIVGKVKLTADKRTNRIHVMTRPVNMKIIRSLIKEFDAGSKISQPAVRQLLHRPVEEVLEAVVSAIKDPGDKEGGGGGGSAQTGAPGAPRPSGGGGSSSTGSFGNDRFGGGGGGGGGSGLSSIGGESLSTGERSNTPIAVQVGTSTIIGDLRNNSILIIGTSDVKEKAFAIIDKLDIEQPMVMIHTILGELTLKENESFGMEYVLRNGGPLAILGTPATPGTNPGDGTGTAGGTSLAPVYGYNGSGNPSLNLNSLSSALSPVSQIVAGGGSGLSGFIAASNAFEAVLSSLESTNRFRVIQRPMIFTSNNKQATITSGEELPIPASINSQFNNNGGLVGGGITSNTSVQYKTIQLKLQVLPRIKDNKDVELEVVQEVSQPNGTTRIDNNDIPNVSSRTIKTFVTVPNQNTLILGGLITDSLSRGKGGINKLVNIPLIGPLFGKSTREKNRTELIVMLRPVVTRDRRENLDLRERTMDALAMPPDMESAIMPQNIREKIAPSDSKEPTLRKGAPIKLREESSKKSNQRE